MYFTAYIHFYNGSKQGREDVAWMWYFALQKALKDNDNELPLVNTIDFIVSYFDRDMFYRLDKVDKVKHGGMIFINKTRTSGDWEFEIQYRNGILFFPERKK